MFTHFEHNSGTSANRMLKILDKEHRKVKLLPWYWLPFLALQHL
jgi:hypothetical protein